MSLSSLSDPDSPGAQRCPSVTDVPEEPKVCAVCGDRATGYHFHVMSCEGCKGFFRRSILKAVHFTCPFTRSCPITKAKRRQCQACRLQKCLDVGMRKDMIMSEEAVGRRRALRLQRRLARAQRGGLTEEQQELISILIAARKRTFDSSFSQFQHYRPAVRLCIPDLHTQSPPGPSAPLAPQLNCLDEDVLPDVFSVLLYIAHNCTFMIQQVIKFAKEIPAFRGLPIDDQISLLKGATLGICQIQSNTVFNEETNAWECGQHCFTIEDGALAGFQQIYLEPLLKFHVSLKKLRLHEAEYVLLLAMLLFSPAAGEGGPHAQELHRPPAPHARGQVPLRQAAAAADGAADPEGGEHAADPPHPAALQHDAAALRNRQLKASQALSPLPSRTWGSVALCRAE
ncbi:nuclear receptor subfamily 1 group I member 3-like isoform X1 [Tympanuchus pallidicinctus]|uniref:nuclear receptor subfamily 1 group I member 3-like isoform X1 n=1 Tax=Tympanuchus pallidicinctus TaxID=109042 RepID=UPI002286F0C8|nr:nuclear receptor subfamily 1 group I member 3-like isoform X1 [Tympanuchus pallidicinctus]